MVQSSQFVANQQKIEEQGRNQTKAPGEDPILKCPQCGYIVNESDLFCENCGCSLGHDEARLGEELEVPQPVPSQIETKEEPDLPLRASQGLKPLIIPGASKNKKLEKHKKSAAKTPELDALIQRSRAEHVKTDLPILGYKDSVEKVTNGWICNFCGCRHDKPGECARPELGGVWQYREIHTTVITKL